MNAVVIIPAYNEVESIAKVISEIPQNHVSEIIVVDNNSNDGTADSARNSGATVLLEQRRGYGAACLKGMEYLKNIRPDTVVFLDGDYSDYPEEIIKLIEPIAEKDYDFVLGSRVIGKREKGSLPIQSMVGSMVAGFLIKLFWKVKYTDLGPFRAIKYSKLLQLDMKDKWFGFAYLSFFIFLHFIRH